MRTVWFNEMDKGGHSKMVSTIGGDHLNICCRDVKHVNFSKWIPFVSIHFKSMREKTASVLLFFHGCDSSICLVQAPL